MIEISGIKYLGEKEAASLIGLSVSWLRSIRHKKEAPPYIRFTKRGKIFYDEGKLKIWVHHRMLHY